MAVTSGKQWRDAVEAQEITLPSGNVARLKKPDILDLVADENAPDLVTTKLMENMGLIGKRSDVTIDKADVPRLFKLLNQICAACFVEPRIVEHATQDDEIELAHIDFNDKLAVLDFAFGQEGLKAQSFRGGSDASVSGLPTRQDLRKAAKRGIGNTR